MRYVLSEPSAEFPIWRICDTWTEGRCGWALEVGRLWARLPDAEGVARQALDMLNGDYTRARDLAQLERMMEL